MDRNTLKKANYINDEITKIEYHIDTWKNKQIAEVIPGVILARINFDATFTMLKESVLYKLIEHKRMLEDELDKL